MATQKEISATFAALGCNVTPESYDGVRDGKVVTTYGVRVSLTSTGSTEVRTIRESDTVDASAVVAEMRKALAKRTKTTRAAIRGERKAT